MSQPRVDLLKVIEGERQMFAERSSDTARHLANLRREFVGQPEVCFLVAAHIVYLRRNHNPKQTWRNFKKLLAAHGDLCVNTMNTRWLVSICDTYADFGTPLERSNALLISTLVNMTKLGETVRLMSVNSQLDLAKIAKQVKEPLWDGMSTYLVREGDMTRHLFSRIGKAVKKTPLLEKIWNEIFLHLQTENTILKQLNDLHERKAFFHRR